jgi:hypothetical protein
VDLDPCVFLSFRPPLPNPPAVHMSFTLPAFRRWNPSASPCWCAPCVAAPTQSARNPLTATWVCTPSSRFPPTCSRYHNKKIFWTALDTACAGQPDSAPMNIVPPWATIEPLSVGRRAVNENERFRNDTKERGQGKDTLRPDLGLASCLHFTTKNGPGDGRKCEKMNEMMLNMTQPSTESFYPCLAREFRKVACGSTPPRKSQ